MSATYINILAECEKVSKLRKNDTKQQTNYKKYIDLGFAAKVDSICSNIQLESFPTLHDYDWTRAHKIKSLTGNIDSSITTTGISTACPTDIIQGNLENSYLLTTLSLLARDSSHIKNLFTDITDDNYKYGVYEVNFTIDGESIAVIIDD